MAAACAQPAGLLAPRFETLAARQEDAPHRLHVFGRKALGHLLLYARGMEIVGGLPERPFGQTFAFRAPVGHLVTIHDRA